MKHFFYKLLPLISALMFITPLWSAQNSAFETAPDESTLWAVGTAWAPDKSEILYKEYHFAENPDLDAPTRVQYRRPDGSLIAEKSMDFSHARSAPAITQSDYRNQSRFDTEFLLDAATSRVRVGFQAYEGDQYRERTLEFRDSLVIDAGFDLFIRDNWSAMTSGRPVSAYFLVPSRLDTVRVNLVTTDRRHCDTADAEIFCFVIRLAGLLRVVGFLVDPIYIAYDSHSQRLLSFSGVSNLLDENRAAISVLINYEYPQDP